MIICFAFYSILQTQIPCSPSNFPACCCGCSEIVDVQMQIWIWWVRLYVARFSYKNSQTYRQPFPGSVALFPSECNQVLCVQYLWQSFKFACVSVLFEFCCLHLVSHHYFFKIFCFTPTIPQRQASQSWPVSSASQTHSPCLTAVCQNQPSKWTHNINPSLLFKAQRLTSEDEIGSEW